MKKTFFLLITVCLSFLSQAQLREGAISLGGTLNFSSNDYDSPSNSFTFSPKVGYFFSDVLSVGSGLTFRSVKQPHSGWRPADSRSFFAISPFTRLHKAISENFYLFGEGMISLGSSFGDGGHLGFYLSPGVLFMPAEKFGIELSFTGISLESNSYNESRSPYQTFRFGPNTFAPNIGLQFYF